MLFPPKATNCAGKVRQKVMSDKVETVKRFYYLGDSLTLILPDGSF